MLLRNVTINPLKSEHTFRKKNTGEEGDSHLISCFIYFYYYQVLKSSVIIQMMKLQFFVYFNKTKNLVCKENYKSRLVPRGDKPEGIKEREIATQERSRQLPPWPHGVGENPGKGAWGKLSCGEDTANQASDSSCPEGSLQ